jgi:hypothetical protein
MPRWGKSFSYVALRLYFKNGSFLYIFVANDLVIIMAKDKKIIKSKTSDIIAEENTDAENIISINGINLTLDNSLKKYANDPFFLEQAEIVNRKFLNHKANTSQSDTDV